VRTSTTLDRPAAPSKAHDADHRVRTPVSLGAVTSGAAETLVLVPTAAALGVGRREAPMPEPVSEVPPVPVDEPT
jgi:hypothetical protein